MDCYCISVIIPNCKSFLPFTDISWLTFMQSVWRCLSWTNSILAHVLVWFFFFFFKGTTARARMIFLCSCFLWYKRWSILVCVWTFSRPWKGSRMQCSFKIHRDVSECVEPSFCRYHNPNVLPRVVALCRNLSPLTCRKITSSVI